MARCGSPTCSCLVQAVPGSNVEVTGSGVPANPYLIGMNPAVLQAVDTPSLDLTVTGDGSVDNPYVISGIASVPISLADFDADTTGTSDSSAAVRAWVQAVVSAEGIGYAPAGDYLLNTAIQPTGLPGKSFSLVGAGRGVTNFIASATNTVGGLVFNATGGSKQGQVTMKDFSVIKKGVGAGTGLAYKMTSGGNLHQRSIVLENIQVAGFDLTQDCFDIGIDVTGTWRPLLDHVYVAGPYGTGIDSDNSNSSPKFTPTCALVLDDAYDYELQSCHFWSGKTGVRDLGDSAEAGRMVDCVINHVLVGFDHYRTSREPILWFDNSHINYRDVGLRLDGAKLVVVRGCHPYNIDTASTYTGTPTDFLFKNTERTIVANNVFHFDGPTDRVNIELDTTTFGDYLMVEGNIFSALAATAIKVGSGATAVFVLGNMYPGTIAQRVADASGTALIMDRTGAGVFAFEQQESGSGIGPVFDLYRNSASPANGDAAGAIRFWANNVALTKKAYAQDTINLTDATAGSEDCQRQIFVICDGTLTQVINWQKVVASSGNTAMSLLVDRAGTVSIQRVSVGATDSGGVGFRALRVPN